MKQKIIGSFYCMITVMYSHMYHYVIILMRRYWYGYRIYVLLTSQLYAS